MNIQKITNSLETILARTFSRSTTENRFTFVLLIFSAIGDFYNICHPNDTQVKAMKVSNREYKLPDFKQLYSKYIETLIENL
jgi:hypothetical protein